MSYSSVRHHIFLSLYFAWVAGSANLEICRKSHADPRTARLHEMALLAVPMAASAFSGPSVGQPSRSALQMQLVPVESEEKVRMNKFGIMQRYLGNTDLLVSECCLGGMTWGDQNTEAEAQTQLNFAFDNGVNFLDTAEGYPVPMAPGTQGATDRAIGKWLKSCFWTREQVVISTKVCGYNERYTWFRESGEGTRLTKGQIIESVDASLKRLVG